MPETPVRLIQMPSERETPPTVLAELRTIHPRAELLYAGNGEWWVGIVTPNRFRYRTGARLLDRAKGQTDPDPNTVRVGQLMVQGFGLVARYTVGDPGRDQVEDFRRRCWQYEHDHDANAFHVAERDAARADEVRRARIRDLVAGHRGAFGHFMRGNRLIHFPKTLRGT